MALIKEVSKRNVEEREKEEIFKKIDCYLEKNFENKTVKFLDLGVKIVRLEIYSIEFLPHIEKQLSYPLKDNSDKFDATLKVWREENIDFFPTKVVDELSFKNNLKLRIQKMAGQIERIKCKVFDDKFSRFKPIFQNKNTKSAKTIEAIDKDNNTYYYALENLDSEELIKEGHLFVQSLNEILKTPFSNLVHGACVGIDNIGALFCARGQRGKSTLAVLSLLKGFEYVSDDYLTLEKKNNKLFASPIYSIITLSPKMYNKLYCYLDECRFVSNNARKDKYVINISKYHNQFKKNYPIELCIFPEITNDDEPSIVLCEKSRAIVQLIHSTLSQMKDLNDRELVYKLYNMVKDLDFYKINLCSDIEKNTELLRKFLKNFKTGKRQKIDEGKILKDITFDIASLIDTKDYTIYVMNKFASNLYQNLLNGFSKDDILNELKKIENMPITIVDEFNLFYEVLKQKRFLDNINHIGNINSVYIKPELAFLNKYKLSIIEYRQDIKNELIR